MSRYYRRLCRAVTKCDVDEVNCLLNVDEVDPNPSVHYMKSPLWIACENNNLEIVRLLITNEFHPADPNIPNKAGKNPLVEAVCQQKMDLATLLMKESQVTVNLNWTWDAYSLLSLAVYHKCLPLVEMLLKGGANPNIPDVNISKLPICLAVYDERPNLQIVQLLLQYGADMKPCCDELFGHAVIGNYSGILELLLEHADDDLLIGCNLCLLNLAIWHDAVACVLVLLHWGFFTTESVLPPFCMFEPSVSLGNFTIMKMLVEVKPQCLQGNWMTSNLGAPAELIEARKHPVRLDILCRTKIIQQLGFKPTAKVEKLPLPRILKDFVQFRDSEHMAKEIIRPSTLLMVQE